jgi:hypothetical protein
MIERMDQRVRGETDRQGERETEAERQREEGGND